MASTKSLPPKAPSSSSSSSPSVVKSLKPPPPRGNVGGPPPPPPPPPPPRGAPMRVSSRATSAGASSTISGASTSSRDGLRREIVRRRQSMSESEFNFLQGVVANGTEVEVLLVHQKLHDPSLCFDVGDGHDLVDDGGIGIQEIVSGGDTKISQIGGGAGYDSSSRRSSLGSVHTPTQGGDFASPTAVFLPPPPPGPINMIGQLLCPTLSMEDNTTLGSLEFDPEASIDTCATGRGKPPAIPIPMSPRADLATFRTPSHAELYPDVATASHVRVVHTTTTTTTTAAATTPRHCNQHQPSSMSDLEQTPLVQNLRPSRDLGGAAELPFGGGRVAAAATTQQQQVEEDLMTPGTNNTSGARILYHRRSSNPLVDQLWRAHEQGLVLTPQQSTRRIQLRREHSLSALSPIMMSRRYSYSTISAGAAVPGTGRTTSSSSSGKYHGSKSMDHSRSLLSPNELRLIKQRHFRTQSYGTSPAAMATTTTTMMDSSSSTSEVLLSSAPYAPWRRQSQAMQEQQQQQQRLQHLDAMNMMMVLQNTSTDDSTDNSNDITSLLLPTDEEIFRRSQQQQQAAKNTNTNNTMMKRPPPPRPFASSVVKKNSSSTTGVSISSSGSGVPKPPTNNLQRISSDTGVAATTHPATIQRRPSALRRMTSDGSQQRSKSVSFQIQDINDNNKGATEEDVVAQQQIALALSQFVGGGDGMDDSLSTYASEHPIHEILRDVGTSSGSGNSNTWNRRDSDCSLNLHKGHPIRQDSIGSTASGWEAAYNFQRELWGVATDGNKNINIHPSHLNRKDSINSVASLNLHRAHPIRSDSIASTIASTAEGANANRHFQEDLVARNAADSSFFQPTYVRRDSQCSVASLNLHRAHPIRQDSIGSVATDNSGAALEAFRRQFPAGRGWGRRESLNSLASLNLHIATPIIQDSIFQHQDSLDSTEVGDEGAGEARTDANAAAAFRPTGWTRRESMSSVASMDLHRANPISHWPTRRDSTNSLASLRLEIAHPIRRDSIVSVAEGYSALESFREEVAAHSWGRRDSCASIASLNLHKARPLRQESISSNAPAGLDATESLRKEFLVEPNTVLKPTWGRQSSMGSLASLNLHRAHPVRSETGSTTDDAMIEILRNKGSAFVSDSDMFELSLNSIPPATKDALKRDIEKGAGGIMRSPSPGTVFTSASDGFLTSSLTSIPSLHPGRPIRQESIASTSAGLEAKELLRQQVSNASIVASEWEGVVLPDEWEDKKTDTDDASEEHLVVKVKARDVPRPVMMRLASNNECDEEGMEVAAVDELVTKLNEENSPKLKLKTQILVPDQPEGAPRRESGSRPTKEEEANMPEREQNAATKQRQDNYRHFPNSLVSFGTDSVRSSAREGRSSSHTVEVSASFDESKSIDRYRGVFRGQLPRSISEDELSSLLMSHCKPKLSRGQSDATIFPSDPEDWELDTVVGEYDAWDAIRDDYINGYGGGGTLPFQIIGTSARDSDSHPHVLSPPLMESLQSFFPISKTSDNFWLKYSMVRDGASLHTLMQRARGARYSILALETTDGEVFGAFTTEPWRKTWNYFGSGESFLWRMRHSRKTQCYSIIDQAAMESEIDVYPYTGANQNVQLCTSHLIAVGGGTPEHTEAEEKRDDHQSSELDKFDEIKDHEWGYGLALQADLQHGTSSPCLTFGSPSLSKVHCDGSVFEICNVELWGLTPCSNLMEAEKLELGRLFLEPSFNPNTFD